LAFDQFTKLGVAEFVEATRDPEALWLFIHIPKTAGSSLSNELARLRRPYRNIHIDYTDRDVPHAEQMQRAVDRFIADAKAKPFRAASGHITMEHARQIRAEIPGTKLFTFVRETAARVISDYRYARTPKHPPYQEFIAAYPDIESYVRDPRSQNKMSLHVGGGDLAKVFAEFDFIGALELYPLSFNLLFSLMGEDVLPQLHERKTPQTADNEVATSNKLDELIRSVNQDDVRLFDAVRDALRSKRVEWNELRQARQLARAPAHAKTA
jgi:hypothetical protein